MIFQWLTHPTSKPSGKRPKAERSKDSKGIAGHAMICFIGWRIESILINACKIPLVC